MKEKYFLSLLFFVNIIFSQNNLTVSIDSPTSLCNVGACANLNANYTDVKSTNDYQVLSIPYSPFFINTGGTYLNASNDDLWSSLFTLPFNFCFYGVSYNQILVGSNGVIHFPNGTQTQGGLCQWSFSSTIPSTKVSSLSKIFSFVMVKKNLSNF